MELHCATGAPSDRIGQQYKRAILWRQWKTRFPLSSERGVAIPLPVPDVLEADEHHYRILVRDLVLECSIGAYAEERLKTQRVRFNLDLRVRRPVPPLN